MPNVGQIISTNFTSTEVVNGHSGAPVLSPSGTLVWSDDPETIYYQAAGTTYLGRTYQDKVTSRFRVFDYHYNRTDLNPDGTRSPGSYNLHIGVALTAPASATGDTYVYRNKFGIGTGTNFPSTAQTTLANWFKSPNQDYNIAVLSPGESTYIEQVVAVKAISVIMYDFVATNGQGSVLPIFVTTYVWKTADPAYPTDPTAVPTIPYSGTIPARATFSYNTLKGSFAPQSSVTPICVALGENPSSPTLPTLSGEYAAGVDALDNWSGAPIYNVGNFGVVYSLDLTIPVPPLGYSYTDTLLNPRGGNEYYVVVDRSGVSSPLSSSEVLADTESLVVDNDPGNDQYTLEYSVPAGQTSPNWLAFQPTT